ncbi:type II secretion system protein [Pseudomonas huanghezhanensis]|uniref:type II secretion system protein n=1 Tax=Pseudomonas huanghezhanensis TaxID=3002903 RepID=UPI00228540B9|nr:type II secretion system protein [Pseudomonas sp. BSw22131]
MSRPHQAGFTLLEMLAALVVMAVCSSVVLVAFGQSARSLQQVERSDRLSLAARSVLDDQDIGILQSGRREGVLDGDIHWTLAVSEQAAKAGQPRLMRLDLTVSEGRRRAQFSTLRLVSPASPGSPGNAL